MRIYVFAWQAFVNLEALINDRRNSCYMNKNTYKLPFILVTSLFFLWGFALNLNPILIPHLKKACQLTDMESAFIDSAFFIAYFLVAIPAGLFMKKYSYKGGILLGLLLFAFGTFLFYPAAAVRAFSFFLLALFVIGSGLTFLETAANPYINALGPERSAATRLNFAQSFNGLAATLAPLMGGTFILSGKKITDAVKQSMTPAQFSSYLDHEASSVQIPYLVIGSVVLMVALLIWRTKLPEIEEKQTLKVPVKTRDLFKEKNLVLGVVAQFFYVGAQVCISSFFIRYSGFVAGLNEKVAAMYLSAALFAFMGGRFIGTLILQYVAPARLLLIYSVFCVCLLIVAISNKNIFGVYSLIGVEFFMSIMFPTIFSLSLIGLKEKAKQGASLLVMSIVGGAILPLIMGRVSDLSSIRWAYTVPIVGFVMVSLFALRLVSKKQPGRIPVQLMHS